MSIISFYRMHITLMLFLLPHSKLPTGIILKTHHGTELQVVNGLVSRFEQCCCFTSRTSDSFTRGRRITFFLSAPSFRLIPFIMEARAHFYREEINSTVWEVPEKYTRLKQIGTGAYGTVW